VVSILEPYVCGEEVRFSPSFVPSFLPSNVQEAVKRQSRGSQVRWTEWIHPRPPSEAEDNPLAQMWVDDRNTRVVM
jgi:hypothetical protein